MAAPRTWLTAVTAALTATALTACDSGPPEDTSSAPPATPPATTSAPTTSAESAPRVRDPLDGSAFAAAPCTSLTAPQLTDLHLGAGQADAAASCTYADPANQLEAQVLFPASARGLDELYARRGHDTDDWTATEIDGYPAVRFRPRKAADVCDLAVGISDVAYVHVRVVAPVDAGKDTCGQAMTVGAAVLATVKAAN